MEQCTRRAAFNEQTFLQINFASCSNPEKGDTYPEESVGLVYLPAFLLISRNKANTLRRMG